MICYQPGQDLLGPGLRAIIDFHRRVSPRHQFDTSYHISVAKDKRGPEGRGGVNQPVPPPRPRKIGGPR
jgi:hypothetical protein